MSDRIDLGREQVGKSQESQRGAGTRKLDPPFKTLPVHTILSSKAREGVPEAPSLDLGLSLGLGLLPLCRTPTSRKHSTPHLNQPEILPNRLNLGGLYSSSLMDRGNIFNARRKAGSTPL